MTRLERADTKKCSDKAEYAANFDGFHLTRGLESTIPIIHLPLYMM